MSEHFIITIDAAHLRIYSPRQEPGQFTPGFDQVEGMDFPLGRRSYTDRETDMAGRFQSSKNQAAAAGAPGVGSAQTAARSGMSIDERLPMKREEGRRRARDLAVEIEGFLSSRPHATWDFAAGPDLNNSVLEQLSPGVRQRLRRSVAKDLVNQGVEQLRVHFSEAR